MSATATAPLALSLGNRRTPVAVILSVALLALAFCAILLGGILAPDATKQDILSGVLPPGSPGHLLGTDELGRDVLAMTIAGAASALIGPVCVAAGSMAAGIFLAHSPDTDEALDFFIGRWTDLLLSLPILLAAIVVAGVFGAGYWMTVLLLIVLFSPSDIRIVRAGALEQANRPYIKACRMLSISPWRIMFRHILPNVSPLIITNGMLNVGFRTGYLFVALVLGRRRSAWLGGLGPPARRFAGIHDGESGSRDRSGRAHHCRGVRGKPPWRLVWPAPDTDGPKVTTQFATIPTRTDVVGVSVTGLTVSSVRGQIVEAFDFAIPPSSTLAIIGESGSGKSSSRPRRLRACFLAAWRPGK